MTVQLSDNCFDWCNELLEARQNFTPEECCSMLKDALSGRKGADPDYVAAVTSRPSSAFPMRKLFYPVYEVRVTPDDGDLSDWDATAPKKIAHAEQKGFAKAYHRGIYKELDPTNYVEGANRRFYVLNRVEDLDGALFPAHCVYTRAELLDAMQKDAKSTHNETPSINRWTCTVCMIPLIEITVEYDGGESKWYFNAHNGAFFCEGYAVAPSIAELAKRTARTLALLRILTYLVGISSMILSFATIDPVQWVASLISLALNLIGGSLVMAKVQPQNEKDLLWEFREDGDRSAAKRKRGIRLLVAACVLLVCTILCAIVW